MCLLTNPSSQFVSVPRYDRRQRAQPPMHGHTRALGRRRREYSPDRYFFCISGFCILYFRPRARVFLSMPLDPILYAPELHRNFLFTVQYLDPLPFCMGSNVLQVPDTPCIRISNSQEQLVWKRRVSLRLGLNRRRLKVLRESPSSTDPRR